MALDCLQNLPNKGTLIHVEQGQVVSRKPEVYLPVSNSSNTQSAVLKCSDQPSSALIRSLKRKDIQPGGKPTAPGKSQLTQGEKRPLSQPESQASRKKPTAAASSQQPASTSTPSAASQEGARRTFSQEELNKKTLKDLQELLRARHLPVSGRKEELVMRIVEYQRKQKRAAQPS